MSKISKPSQAVETDPSQEIPSARLRRHLAMCMLAAFVTQIAQNFGAVTTDNNVACRVAGEQDWIPKIVELPQELPHFQLSCCKTSSLQHSAS